MGVYVKGMDMPKCCAECDAEGHYENYNGDEYGFFCPFGYKAYTEETRDAKRLDNCPLVPVPPHGRLIDADALLERFEKEEKAADEHGRDFSFSFKSGGENCTEWWPVQQMLMDAPTIIPAEEGDYS